MTDVHIIGRSTVEVIFRPFEELSFVERLIRLRVASIELVLRFEQSLTHL